MRFISTEYQVTPTYLLVHVDKLLAISKRLWTAHILHFYKVTDLACLESIIQ